MPLWQRKEIQGMLFVMTISVQRTENSMGNSKLVGIVLLVIGVGLFYFGYQSSQSLGNQLSETVTGRFTDETTWYLIGGAAAAAGVILAFFKK
jgi:uncharacterized protein YjeT (DUF2065 family)